MIGKTLLHFEITEKLGEGGMGTVYRAEDKTLGRQVAIKVLPEEFTSDPERLARFEREAKVLAALDHPHIASIYALESAPSEADPDGQATRFLVMQLAEGETLSEIVARGSLSVERSLDLAHQITLALESAHEKGIIHRDLKPANVKVTPEGQAIVLDFGLAKAMADEEETSVAGSASLSPTLTAQMTQAGVLLGTAAYMAPEQARGQVIDKRADVWAYGCVVLEMLTGQQVFAGDTITDVLAALVTREPDWEALPAEAPRAVRRMLRRCLEKDPNRRLRDIADARLEIEEAREGETLELESAGVSQAQASRGSRRWIAVSIALAILAAVLGFFALPSAPPPREVIRAHIPAPPGNSFDLDVVTPQPPVFSPDGKSIVFGARDGEGVEQLWIQRLDEAEARPLAGTESGQYPFWAPDSESIAFFSDGRLKKIDTSGGPALNLAPANNGKGGSWGTNGVILFAPDSAGSIFKVSADGGEAESVTELLREESENSHRFPVWLPGQERFLFMARVTLGAEVVSNKIMLASLNGDTPRLLLNSPTNVVLAADTLLFVRENTLMAQGFDTERLELVGGPQPMIAGVSQLVGAAYGVFSATDSGRLLYLGGSSAGQGSSLVWRDREGDDLGALSADALHLDVQLSPDETMAVTSIGDVGGGYDLWLVDVERGIRSRFTFDPASDWAPAWSHDGKRIAFTSVRGGSQDIWIKDVDGNTGAQLFLESENNIEPLDWAPNDDFLLYSSVHPEGHTDLYMAAATGESELIPVLATPFSERHGRISPDGRWLAYNSNESGEWEIYVTSFPEAGRKWQISEDGGSFPIWGPDGEELFFILANEILMSVRIDGAGSTLQIGEVVPLFPTFRSADPSIDIAVTADSQRFLINAVAPRSELDLLTLVLNWDAELPRP